MSNKKLLTIREVAKALKISYHRVLRMVHANKIKAIRPGNEWLIAPSEILGWAKVRHQTQVWLERRYDENGKPLDTPLQELIEQENQLPEVPPIS